MDEAIQSPREQWASREQGWDPATNIIIPGKEGEAGPQGTSKLFVRQEQARDEGVLKLGGV